MRKELNNAILTGTESVSAWSDILDSINVFPVADGDTGRNLSISLAPLRKIDDDVTKTIKQLLFSARGNSGNIAALFFSGLLTADSIDQLPQAIRLGRDRALNALAKPVKGTMLTVLDVLVEKLEESSLMDRDNWHSEVIELLGETVRLTPTLLPILKDAKVVDAGALGIYIFFNSFFQTLSGNKIQSGSFISLFEDMLDVSPQFQDQQEPGYCVDMLIKIDKENEEILDKIYNAGNDVVILKEENQVKIHLHTNNREQIRKTAASLGNIVGWSDDNIDHQISDYRNARNRTEPIHIVTDAAGSITRKDSQDYGLTIMDSYITIGDKTMPETYWDSEEIYSEMRNGKKVYTAQASVFERHQYYTGLLSRHERVLYLCVGTAYTGNYTVALNWKQSNDIHNKFTIIDTTAASGRLGLLTLSVSKFASQCTTPTEVIDYANSAINSVQEYIFLDKLQYLAAGGRLSKSSAFFGDLLHMKPIVSPTAEGAQKVGVAKNEKDQIAFILNKLGSEFEIQLHLSIMLQYTDNYSWVTSVVKKEIEESFPDINILVRPLSLTTGVHTGPGTWAVSFAPNITSYKDSTA